LNAALFSGWQGRMTRNKGKRPLDWTMRGASMKRKEQVTVDNRLYLERKSHLFNVLRISTTTITPFIKLQSHVLCTFTAETESNRALCTPTAIIIP
jgi:hypothetical protein